VFFLPPFIDAWLCRQKEYLPEDVHYLLEIIVKGEVLLG
jgi:hypothetical protein